MKKIEISDDAKIAVSRGLSGVLFAVALSGINGIAQHPTPEIALVAAMCSMACAFMLWRS